MHQSDRNMVQVVPSCAALPRYGHYEASDDSASCSRHASSMPRSAGEQFDRAAGKICPRLDRSVHEVVTTGWMRMSSGPSRRTPFREEDFMVKAPQAQCVLERRLKG